MPQSGHFRIVDQSLRRVDIPIRDVVSKNAMETFVQRIATYLVGEIQKATYTESTILSIPGLGSGPLTAGQSLKLFMRDTTNGKNRMLELPAPDWEMFEFTSEDGYRIKTAIGELITGYFADLVGAEMVFQHGKLTGDPW